MQGEQFYGKASVDKGKIKKAAGKVAGHIPYGRISAGDQCVCALYCKAGCQGGEQDKQDLGGGRAVLITQELYLDTEKKGISNVLAFL